MQTLTRRSAEGSVDASGFSIQSAGNPGAAENPAEESLGEGERVRIDQCVIVAKDESDASKGEECTSAEACGRETAAATGLGRVGIRGSDIQRVRMGDGMGSGGRAPRVKRCVSVNARITQNLNIVWNNW